MSVELKQRNKAMIRVTKVEARHDSENRTGKLHFWFKGETVVDHMFNRFNEPYKAVKPLLPEILAQAGVVGLEKASWSQKCGCSCGCSPGFKLNGATYEGDTQFTVYVDLECVGNEIETPINN
jgi:hypothetical protein